MISSLSCNAIQSSGFLVSKVRKVIHFVCTLGDMACCLYCFFIIQGESKVIFIVVVQQNLNWLLSISGKLGRIGTGTLSGSNMAEDQIWPMLTQYHELQTDLKCFL